MDPRSASGWRRRSADLLFARLLPQDSERLQRPPIPRKGTVPRGQDCRLQISDEDRQNRTNLTRNHAPSPLPGARIKARSIA